MKKILALTIFTLSFAQPLFAQYNKVITHKPKERKNGAGILYFRLGVGYALPLAGQLNDNGNGGYFNGNTVNTSSQNSFDIKRASFGSGFWTSIAGGCMITHNIGIDLSAHLGFGTKYTNSYDNDNATGSSPSQVTIVQAADRPLFINPALLLTTHQKKVNVYTRFGVAIPIVSRIKKEITFTMPNGPFSAPDIYNETILVRTYFSLGLTGAAGINVHVNKARFFAEINTLSINVDAKEEELRAASVNNNNALGQITNTKISLHYSGTEHPTYSIPFSNVGLAVGFIWGLN